MTRRRENRYNQAVLEAFQEEDVIALMLEQKFIKGFVKRFKDKACIYAWDLGKESNLTLPKAEVDAVCLMSEVSNFSVSEGRRGTCRV